ncbi:hypothetical protein CLOM_g6157 [Closterium sp. NIES-68]|nr:hypothetical protein CLOM_g6157 [Closterium sp. NIES-68]GJP63164.1 hypothetical protein CLOP_g20236 [Closterium sp. NIES-67]
MAWLGTARHGMAWRGVAWCGMVWHGMALHVMAWHQMRIKVHRAVVRGGLLSSPVQTRGGSTLLTSIPPQ